MDLDAFIRKRQPQWRRLEAILRRVEGSGLPALDEDQAVEFGRLYRCAASDLNQAQTFVSGDATVRQLNDLVARCYLVIYANDKVNVWAFLRYVVLGYPAVFRRHWRAVLLATILLSAGTLFGYLAAFYDRDAVALLMPAGFPTIQPADEGEDRQTAPMSSDELTAFSTHLFTNNVSVSLVAFVLGLTFGVGTAWVMFYNGILVGVLAAVFVRAGQFTAYATGILPHGVLEFPAILIGGGAGFVLAGGMIRARPWPRRDELVRVGRDALHLVVGCFPLLALAAILEAGVARAPDWVLGSGVKLATAAVFALLFAAYVLLPGWGARIKRLPGVRGA